MQGSSLLYSAGRSGKLADGGVLWRRLAGSFARNKLNVFLWHLTEDRYEGAMMRYLHSWIDQLRWQRLKPMEKLADMLVNDLAGILNYGRTKVSLGVVEAVTIAHTASRSALGREASKDSKPSLCMATRTACTAP